MYVMENYRRFYNEDDEEKSRDMSHVLLEVVHCGLIRKMQLLQEWHLYIKVKRIKCVLIALYKGITYER